MARPVNSISLALRAPHSHVWPWYSTPPMPMLDDRVGELRVVGGDDQVARPAQQQAAGDADPLDGGDRRLRDVPPPQRVLEEPLGLDLVDPGDGPARRGAVVVSDGADVVPGGEVLAVGLQDDDTDVGVVSGHPPCLVEVVEQLEGLGVRRLGAVERDRGDAVGNRVVDESCFQDFPLVRIVLSRYVCGTVR